MMTKTSKQRYLVSASYKVESEYPRVMGYYDADNPEEAFKQFLKEYAPDARRANLFSDDVMVIPVPKTGYKYNLTNIYGGNDK